MNSWMTRSLQGILFSCVLVSAGCGGGGNSTPVTNQTTPSITWATPTAITFGTALSATQLDATASVAGTFTYSPALGATPTAGTQALSVTFTPNDTTDYKSATASVSLVVNKVTPALTWATPAAIAYSTPLSATQLDASAGSIAGAFVYAPAAGAVLTVGSQTLTATFTPTDTTDYNNAAVSTTLSVTKPVTSLGWATPAAIVYGTSLSAAQLDATANVPGTYVYTPALGTVLTAGSKTLSVTFTPTDAADYASASSSVTLTVNQATPVITWPTPAAVVQGATLGAIQLAATANVPGTFNYSPAAGFVENSAGTATLSTTFTPTDGTNYATASASVSLLVNSTAGAATVDFGTQEQSIRGFGGSEAWSSAMPLAQISALYGAGSNQLGLSIMRVRIAPTTWNSSTQTAGTSAWTAELSNAFAAHVVASDAIVFASPWSPPTTMKSNGSVNEGSLNTANYADYANYLEAYVNYAKTQNVNLYAISMQNEPDWNPCDPSGTDEGPNGKDCYESCLWTAAQMDTWVASNSSALTVPLIMPESLNFNHSMADTTLNDTNAASKVSIVGGHLYGSSPSYYTLAKSLNKDLWMTEHYLSPVSGGISTSIADALAAAKEIHNSMTVGQYNAYIYWWMVNTTSMPYLVDSSGNPTYFGYALGQFSKWVRPGYYRYNVTATPVAGVYVSAYAGSGHFVIVAINANTTATSLPIVIANQTITSLTPYQTSATANMAAQSVVSVSGNTFTYALPAQSITTFVQ